MISELKERFALMVLACLAAGVLAFLAVFMKSSYESGFFIFSAYLFAIADFFHIWHRKGRLELLRNFFRGTRSLSVAKSVEQEKQLTVSAAIGREFVLRGIILFPISVILFLAFGPELAIGVVCSYLFLSFVYVCFNDMQVEKIDFSENTEPSFYFGD